MSQHFDLIIIGAGAAGLMCAATAAKRQKTVLVLDHANKAGKKILMSGGGRCNFTNYHIENDCYLSSNPHFFKSALKRFTQWDFIALVEKYGIAYHEKKLGQLFCDHSAQDIVKMLLAECGNYGVEIRLETSVTQIIKKTSTESSNEKPLFHLKTSNGSLSCAALVIATGGLSIPTMGASGFGYQVARQFGLDVLPTRAGLVPFTMPEKWLNDFSDLSGTAIEVMACCNKKSFREHLLFTHRGLSGPVILQLSSYWELGDEVSINLLPDIDAFDWISAQQKEKADTQLVTLLASQFSKKFAQKIGSLWFDNKPLKQLNTKDIKLISEKLHHWVVKPHGTEGYRTAEITLGGIDVEQISSKTMEVKKVPGLYFIGEVLDVAGHLGGYNFQWAWASGVAAGESV